MKIIFNYFLATLFFSSYTKPSLVDVAIGGPAIYYDGIGRLSISFLTMFNNKFNCGFFITKPDTLLDFTDIPNNLHELLSYDITAAKVLICTDALWLPGHSPLLELPDACIKIAYSMFETTAIPQEWVIIINEKFDAVVVPDPFLIDVYKQSGVTKPIFQLPVPLDLEPFFARQVKSLPGEVFTFGSSMGLYSNHKNWELLIQAFFNAYGNNPHYLLKIHGRFANDDCWNSLVQKVTGLNCSNIQLIYKNLSQKELIDFMASLDCYVLLSKGEGFSITPREALALGVPCILANNTAQKTLCASGFVLPVESSLAELAYKKDFGDLFLGYNFNCHLEDAVQAFFLMVDNYPLYKQKALQGRLWVEQYTKHALFKKYSTLIAPTKIILGTQDSIEEDYVVTSSWDLYNKYQKVTSL
jgi:glycosyltransferase involved in cell wall biosynthesis